MAVGIAERFDYGRTTHMIDAEERMLLCRRKTRVGRRFDGTVGSVFEADRHRHARRELAMHLAFRIASADRTPADRVGNVLRAGWFQEFRGGGQTCVQYAKQRTTGQKQAFFDIAAAVDVGIVDQAFPTDRRTRFFEIHAHHNQQFSAQLVFQRGQATGVIECGSRIMHGTRTDDHQQSIVLAVQAGTNLIA